ncbi:serine/threonine-protein kinase [Arthrobacter yangruifuii]|nr:serine/threonine-protein kinase [Arthrobacter yangruifuii]
MERIPPTGPPDDAYACRGGTPPPLPPPAPEVPGFRVDRLLGVGGSAAVWLVLDPDGARFALKVPARREQAAMNAFGARREGNILSRLEHPHLVKVHKVVDTDQGAGLVVAYAPGGSAAGLVAARGPIQPGEAVSILVGIAGALGYLHQRGTAHGDVSPGNILFTSEGRPLLADFGSGRLLGEPGTGHPGTPGFAAPGRREGRDAGLGAASDIYALAAVGWFLLTGRVPPASRVRPPLPILVPGVGRELSALLEAGLAEDADQRPDAEQFAAAAYRCLPALPVDLVAAVHPDVHPELLTRRTGSAGSGAGGRGAGGWKGRWRLLGRQRGGGAAGRLEGRRDRERRDGRRPEEGPEQPQPRRRRHGGSGGGSAGPTARRRSVRGNPVRGRSAGSGRPDPQGAPGGGVRAGGRRQPSTVRFRGPGMFPVTAAAVVAVVLILAVIALAAPELLRAGGAAVDARDGSSGNSRGTARDAATLAAPAASPAEPAEPATEEIAVESLRAETAAEDPARALAALAELRTRAFTGADPALLDHVNAPGSEAQLADQEQVGRLAAEGQTLAGLVMTVDVLQRLGTVPAETTVPAEPTMPGQPVRREAPEAGSAELRVRMQVSAYTRVDRTGAVLRHEPAQQQEVMLVLVRSEGMWRISRVLAPS